MSPLAGTGRFAKNAYGWLPLLFFHAATAARVVAPVYCPIVTLLLCCIPKSSVTRVRRRITASGTSCPPTLDAPTLVSSEPLPSVPTGPCGPWAPCAPAAPAAPGGTEMTMPGPARVVSVALLAPWTQPEMIPSSAAVDRSSVPLADTTWADTTLPACSVPEVSVYSRCAEAGALSVPAELAGRVIVPSGLPAPFSKVSTLPLIVPRSKAPASRPASCTCAAATLPPSVLSELDALATEPAIAPSVTPPTVASETSPFTAPVNAPVLSSSAISMPSPACWATVSAVVADTVLPSDSVNSSVGPDTLTLAT